MSTPSFNKLLAKLQSDYSELEFTPGNRYLFSPPKTIHFDSNEPHPLLLLHELGHYLTKHYDYHGDIELLKIEADAWQNAKQLCAQYGVTWDEDFAQDRLDSYRDWLHAGSTCTNCQINGYQDSAGLYHCPLCSQTWHNGYSPE